MVPFSPSTVMICPSFKIFVAFLVPTTAGVPSSRLTMAAWQVMPPSSVTMALTRRIAGTISGLVIFVTSMSPSLTALVSLMSRTITTRPLAMPGDAPCPSRSATPDDLSDLLSAPERGISGRRIVVIGLDWRMKRSPATIAHSTSCGMP